MTEFGCEFVLLIWGLCDGFDCVCLVIMFTCFYCVSWVLLCVAFGFVGFCDESRVVCLGMLDGYSFGFGVCDILYFGFSLFAGVCGWLFSGLGGSMLSLELCFEWLAVLIVWMVVLCWGSLLSHCFILICRLMRFGCRFAGTVWLCYFVLFSILGSVVSFRLLGYSVLVFVGFWFVVWLFYFVLCCVLMFIDLCWFFVGFGLNCFGVLYVVYCVTCLCVCV